MMTMTQAQRTQLKATEQRQLAQLWRTGMVLLLVGIVGDTIGQVCDDLMAHRLQWNQLDWFSAFALTSGVVGLGLTLYAALQFQKGPQPRFTVYGINKGMDEREIARLLEAQAKAQQLFARCLLGLALTGGAWGRNGLHLSWWSCLLGLVALLNAVIYLPISFLAAEAKDMEDEE